MTAGTKTTEEKIRICIAYLQRHGYQVIVPKNSRKQSAHVAKLVEEQRETMLKLGGASAATLLNAADVSAMTGISIETLTYHIRRNGFPRPIMGGGGGSGSRTRHWRLTDVQEFVQKRVET